MVIQEEPAETPDEELDRLIDFCKAKSREYADRDYRERYPLTEKSRKISGIASLLETNRDLFTDVEEPEQVEEKVISWAEDKVDAVNPEYSLTDMSCFIELTKECRRRLMNYEDGLMDVTLRVRRKWWDKYG